MAVEMGGGWDPVLLQISWWSFKGSQTFSIFSLNLESTFCFIVVDIHLEVNFSFIGLFVIKADSRFQNYMKYDFVYCSQQPFKLKADEVLEV